MSIPTAPRPRFGFQSITSCFAWSMIWLAASIGLGAQPPPSEEKSCAMWFEAEQLRLRLAAGEGRVPALFDGETTGNTNAFKSLFFAAATTRVIPGPDQTTHVLYHHPLLQAAWIVRGTEASAISDWTNSGWWMPATVRKGGADLAGAVAGIGSFLAQQPAVFLEEWKTNREPLRADPESSIPVLRRWFSISDGLATSENPPGDEPTSSGYWIGQMRRMLSDAGAGPFPGLDPESSRGWTALDDQTRSSFRPVAVLRASDGDGLAFVSMRQPWHWLVGERPSTSAESPTRWHLISLPPPHSVGCWANLEADLDFEHAVAAASSDAKRKLDQRFAQLADRLAPKVDAAADQLRANQQATAAALRAADRAVLGAIVGLGIRWAITADRFARLAKQPPPRPRPLASDAEIAARRRAFRNEMATLDAAAGKKEENQMWRKYDAFTWLNSESPRVYRSDPDLVPPE